MNKPILVTLSVALVLAAAPAHAQTAVVDHVNLIQNIKTALQTAQVVENTAQQLQTMEAQLKYQIQNLSTLNPASISGLLSLINQTQMTFNMLQGDLSSIGYTVGLVNGNFNRLFPKNQNQWKNVRSSDFNAYYDNWNNEITTSSLAAIRAQTAVSSVDANNAGHPEDPPGCEQRVDRRNPPAAARQPAARAHPHRARLASPEPHHRRPRHH